MEHRDTTTIHCFCNSFPRLLRLFFGCFFFFRVGNLVSSPGPLHTIYVLHAHAHVFINARPHRRTHRPMKACLFTRSIACIIANIHQRMHMEHECTHASTQARMRTKQRVSSIPTLSFPGHLDCLFVAKASLTRFRIK